MTLVVGGQVHLQLNCNRATGTWTAEPPDAESGAFTFGRLAMTRALCPPPSYDSQIARDAEVRPLVPRRDGRLYLSLMADGGTYVWAPRAPSPPAAPERAAWQRLAGVRNTGPRPPSGRASSVSR